MAETPNPVELLGDQHAVTLPDFAAREELVVAYSEAVRRKGLALLRVYAAVLGLCTRLGRRAEADYGRARYDVLAYGGEVYGWLRVQGVTQAELAAAAAPLVVLLAESLFPRAAEVETARGNSEGSAGR